MNSVETKLTVLIDGMLKKEQALTEIVNITENQGTVLASGMSEDEIRTFIVQMNQEKQAHIKTVISCDNLFESLLKELGPEIDAHTDLYKPQIAELQSLIKRVMDLDVKIRVCEEQNTGKKNKTSALPQENIKTRSPDTKQTPIIQDGTRLIKAYEVNSKNYKG